MNYKSTRGDVAGISFKEAVMMGLATDGGILIPETIPDLSDQLDGWANLSYTQLAVEIMSPFIDDISRADLTLLIERSYSTFNHIDIAPVRTLGPVQLMELFHGPTLAFKDVALQFLGNTFEYILKQRNTSLNILAATSGDTGSAAIAGIRGKQNINIFIMFPEGKTSPVQELQMTSVLDANVHNIAIEGSFDDCQTLMKSIFSDSEFKQKYCLGAVNSVNWARVLAQIVYYFYAYYKLGCPKHFDVCVPTGNFGNIFAGYMAKQMGLPIRHLILASNSNDILVRFFETGVYQRGKVSLTHSPAMDIQVSSNFERYLYYLCGTDSAKVKVFMDSFLSTGKAQLESVASADKTFRCASVSNEETIELIRRYAKKYQYIVDPHTAVGLNVAEQMVDSEVPLLCLSTAHPAKFGDVMAAADVKVSHPTLAALKGLATKKTVIAPDIDRIKALIVEG